MDPKTLTYTDVSKTLFKGKEAMNVGISEVKYLDRDYGEGFIINNNLSATYYYFPATNRLYTEEAFKYARELTPNQLNGEIRDTTYLELQEENVSETSSKGGMLRLWKIHAKFHLGDPQDFGFYNWIQKRTWRTTCQRHSSHFMVHGLWRQNTLSRFKLYIYYFPTHDF